MSSIKYLLVLSVFINEPLGYEESNRGMVYNLHINKIFLRCPLTEYILNPVQTDD